MTTPSPLSLWQLLEPVHAVTYFDPAADEPMRELGVESFWARYVLKRAAALGPVGPAVVTAAFHVFHPRRAQAVLPHGWDAVSPQQALTARADGARRALTGVAGSLDLRPAADLLWPIAQAADCAGLVLAAAEQAVPRPDDPVTTVWQALTTLREHRGSGHVAALVAHGVGPVEAMQLKAAAGESVGADLRLGRGWSESAWAQGELALHGRGWVVAGTLTDEGRAARDTIEAATDAVAAQPWRAVPAADLARVEDVLTRLAEAVWAAGYLPERNPIGVTRRAAG